MKYITLVFTNLNKHKNVLRIKLGEKVYLDQPKGNGPWKNLGTIEITEIFCNEEHPVKHETWGYDG